MSENGCLTSRYIKREKQIFLNASENGGKRRSVPLPLFWKLLDAAEYALKHGYDSPDYKKQIEMERRQQEQNEIISDTESVQ